MIKSITPAIICLTTLLFLSSCNETTTPPVELATVEVKVAAIVNGKIITEQEVREKLKTPKDHDLNPELKLITLKMLVRKELAAQKAIELGLDNDPTYAAQLQRLTMQLNTFRRDKLSELFEAVEIQAKAIVTDTEVVKFIADNNVRIRSESHILQLMQRSEEQIQQISGQLAAGKSLDAVATDLFPELPSNMNRPWDLGYMNWEQIPDAWNDTLANMQPGETSGIIKGPNERFWIIHLVDRRTNDTIDMESLKGKILQILQREKFRKLKEQTMQALNDAAEIFYPEAQKH